MFSRVLSIVAILPIVVFAFPTSIGSCLPGKAAINQGAHANLRQLGGGAIGDAGFQVFIDGKQVYQDVVFDFIAGMKHSIELVATQDVMRGFLLRLESTDGQDTRDALDSTDSQVTVPFFCTESERVGGLGHVGRQQKVSIEGTLYIAKPSSELQLDVTTVVTTIYSYGIAEWYVSQFKLRAVAPGSTISYEQGTTTSITTTTPCVAVGVYCASDAACCSDSRCIRESTDNIWAAGFCQVQGSQSTTSTQGVIAEAPASTTGSKGDSCSMNSQCKSSRCLFTSGLLTGVCWGGTTSSSSRQSQADSKGGAGH